MTPQQPPEGLGSRDRILWAASTMLGEEAGAALSVRAVAARAGVSTGSLRHHFPTQRALMDTVLPIVYDLVLPDDDIHDRSIPARDRLVASLQRLFAPPGITTSARENWITMFDRYGATDPTDAVRAEYLAIERELLRRIEVHLVALQDEGALAEGDNARRAAFLSTVLNGISIAQALPAETSPWRSGVDVLHDAVDCVLDAQVWRTPSSPT